MAASLIHNMPKILYIGIEKGIYRFIEILDSFSHFAKGYICTHLFYIYLERNPIWPSDLNPVLVCTLPCLP